VSFRRADKIVSDEQVSTEQFEFFQIGIKVRFRLGGI